MKRFMKFALAIYLVCLSATTALAQQSSDLDISICHNEISGGWPFSWKGGIYSSTGCAEPREVSMTTRLAADREDLSDYCPRALKENFVGLDGSLKVDNVVYEVRGICAADNTMQGPGSILLSTSRGRLFQRLTWTDVDANGQYRFYIYVGERIIRLRGGCGIAF